MMRLSRLTSRKLLIAVHDALATALALFASLYLRFEGEAFLDRLPLLLRVLPFFTVFSIVVCYASNLTSTKWRFISLPDALNIVRVATGLTLACVLMDYVFAVPTIQGRLPLPSLQPPYFLGKITIVLYWFLEIFFLSALRFAYRYFRYSRTRYHARSEGASPALLIGRAADAEVLLRGIESGAVKHLWPVGVLSPSPADHGQSIRNIPVQGGIEDFEDVIADFARRNKPIARLIMTPSAFEPDARPESVLMRDRERILRLMSEFKPDIVFHAAALKHVPILERDWSEGVKTNIFGSINVADAALAAGAEAMVMISTDKAIEPVSMLGLTKRFAEMYCQALDHHLASKPGSHPRMRLISVRFGNVLASNGSVVPKFKAQIEAGGPVTVTHPDMVRYFITIREASDLVITARTH